MLTPLFQFIVGNELGVVTPVQIQDAYLLVVKILFLLGALLYIAFAVIVIRQITVMSETLITTLSPTIRLLSYLHFLFALMVLIFFFMLL